MVDFRCHGTHSNVFGLVFQNPTSGRFYFTMYKASIENHCVEVRKICECITAICVPRCNVEVGYNVVLLIQNRKNLCVLFIFCIYCLSTIEY